MKSRQASSDIPESTSKILATKKYTRIKRPPPRPTSSSSSSSSITSTTTPTTPNSTNINSKTHLFISRKSSYLALLSRAEKLLFPSVKSTSQPGFPFITLHGLGHATEKAVRLACHLKNKYGDLIVLDKIETGTVELVDDLVPLDENQDTDTHVRQSSSITIRVRKQMEITDVGKLMQ